MVDKKKFAEEESQGYRIDIVGRNLDVTEPMKNYAWDKLSKIERFHNHIMYVHVTLDIQKLEHTCIIVLKIDHTKVKVQASSTDMYPSIDRAVDRLQNLLRRYKSRIQDHHKKGLAVTDMQVNVLERPYDEIAEINDDIEQAERQKQIDEFKAAKIIGTEVKPLKTLTAAEALMKMDLSGDSFLVFRAEEDCKLKVLYRRTDGNYGLIQPE
ncbi:MAG: ribosome-associated translation inhibitor RaiA [Rhabdochlamydiaceae bacterium]|nr:ribosome-associated translation inhibitor RaiA [Rhabdochlamydiaceae bacterium]